MAQTRTDFNQIEQQKFATQKANSDKAACAAKGGTWNEATQTCDFAGLGFKQQSAYDPMQSPALQKQVEPVQTDKKFNPTQPEIIRDERGNVTGLNLPDGRKFNNLSPENVNSILSKYNQTPSEVTRQGLQPAGTEQSQMQAQQRTAELTQMAQQGLLSPQELQAIQGASPDMGQAAGAGLLGAVPGLVGVGAGLALSATGVGSVAGVPLATAGAISAGAAITGFLSSMRSNIKQQQSEQFSADVNTLTKSERYLRGLITDTNKNPQNAPENIAMFYHTLNMIDAAHQKTWKDSQENVNKFLGNDGTVELSKFEVFDSTMRNYYIQSFNSALSNPNPNQILITNEDLTADE